jgi:hypothetical protein
MPTVPRYEPGKVRVQNLPNARLDVQDVSSGTANLARGLQAVSATAEEFGRQQQEIAKKEREKAEAAQLMEADRKLSQWEVDTLYAPETGLLNRKGKDALGVQDQALPAFDKLASEAETSMPEALRMRFRQLADGRRQDVQRQLFRHVSQQSDVILESEAKAYEQTALANIAVHAGDNERVSAETDRLWAAKLTTLTRLGATPEVIKAERAGMEASVHGAVLDQFLARSDYQGAIAYYDQNREALGVRADEYGKAVQQARLVVQETSESDRIIAGYGTGPAAIAAARKIDDPILRERVESRIDREAARRDRLVREGEKAVRESAWSKIEQAPAGADLYSVLTPKDLAALSEMPGVLADMERRADAKLRGLETKTDPRTVDELQRAMYGKPEVFAAMDLTQHFGKLAPQDRDYFARAQASMREPSKQAEAASEDRQLATYVWGPLGISAGGEKDGKARGEFFMAYEAEKRAFIDATGKAPNDVERKDIMQRLMLPMLQKDWIFDNESRAFQVQPGTEAEYRADVPKAEREKIADAYQRKLGRQPTEIEIADAYSRRPAGN